ncbi:MAG: hypothetical protein JW732_07765 [Dehalococcoidia bacterium]|nr:hypothetical protein [Dehalococcoidia bacterium]
MALGLGVTAALAIGVEMPSGHITEDMLIASMMTKPMLLMADTWRR